MLKNLRDVSCLFQLTVLVCSVVVQTALATQNQRVQPTPNAELEALKGALSENKQYEAHELLIGALRRPHLDSDFLLQLGIQFAEHELYEDAARAFDRCIEEHPTIFEAYYNLALADIAQEKWDAAIAAIERAPQQSRAQVLASLYLRGKVEQSRGQSDDAERDLSETFAGDPENPAYGMDLGLLYLRKRAYPRAAAVFEQAAKHNSGSPFLILGLSLSQFLAGQSEQSIEVLRNLLSAQPAFSPAQLLLAFVLSVQGKLEDAEKVARQGLSSPHPSPYLEYLHASILVRLQSREYERIFAELDIAQRQISSCALCYFAESKAHQAQGNFGAAIADLEMALNVDSGFREAWSRLAPLYYRVGRTQDALRAQERFQQLESDREERERQMLSNSVLNSLNTGDADQR